MGVKKFEIVMDSLVCYSGQNISGKLLVNVEEEPAKIRGIRLNYIGKANVRWTEGSGKNKRTYSSEAKYLDLQQLVHGDYEHESELAVGQYVFIFSCALPKDSPCSYEGAYGRIKYCVKATMDIPWKRDPTAKQKLTVVSVFDLNNLPVAAASVLEESSKTFWGQSDSLSMAFKLPIRGYVPGQIMSIAVNLDNRTDIRVKRVTAELHQNVMFHATTKSRHWKELITRSEYNIDDSAGMKQAFLRIKVPALPPSYLEFCSIIDLRYHLTVAAEVSGLHTNLESSTEILIGNVPLMAYQRPVGHQVPPTAPVEPVDLSQGEASNYRPPPYNVVSPLSTMYGDLSPPSYEQCMKLAALEQDKASSDSDSDVEPRKFASLYPVWKFDPLTE